MSTRINHASETDFLRWVEDMYKHKPVNRKGYITLYKRSYLKVDFDRMKRHAQKLKAMGSIDGYRIAKGGMSLSIKLRMPTPHQKLDLDATNRIVEKLPKPFVGKNEVLGIIRGALLRCKGDG